MSSSDLRVTEHFTILIYPFRHTFVGPDRMNRLDHLPSRWLPWWRRFDRPDLERVLDDTYFFLPFVREQLFPETKRLPAPGSATWTDAVDRLASYAHPLSVAETLDADAVLRLTYAPERLTEVRPLKLEYRREDAQGAVVEGFETDFDLFWVDAVLFPQGVGFLLLKVRLSGGDLTVGRINDLLSYSRVVHPPKHGWTMARWITDPHGIYQRRERRTARELVDLFLADLADRSPTGFSSPPRRSSPYSVTPEGQTYGQHFRLYTYVGLAENRSPPATGEEAGGTDGTSAGSPDAADSPFLTPADQALYELATCSRIDKPDSAPHPAYADHLMTQHRAAIWNNWLALVLQDHVVFLGVRPTPFVRGVLPHNVERDYLQLYLLTLYQKLRLTIFAGELQRSTTDLYGNLQDARRLWHEFILFRNHYWFSEVTRGFQGTELYRRFQEGQNLRALYDEVSGEVTLLQEFFEQAAQRRINGLLNVLTLGMVPLGILASVFGPVLVRSVSWPEALIVGAAFYAVIFVVWAAVRQPWQ